MLEKYYNVETKTLTLPHNFDEELKDLSSNTKIIIFEDDTIGPFYSIFNKSVDNLPNSITNLTFGRYFNQLVDATRKNFIFTGAPKNNVVFDGDNLPKNLTHLIFGFNFSQSVDNLPENLIHLRFGYKFNQKIDNLPLNIKQIKMYKQQIHLLKKVPFECKIIDDDNKEIFL